MKTISSAEFRKSYQRLHEMTAVTVNGHPIGIWNPRAPYFPDGSVPDVLATHYEDGQGGEFSVGSRHRTDRLARAFERGESQAQRDAILRKINKRAD